MKCKYCSMKAIYKATLKSTGEEIKICEWCESDDIIDVVELNPKSLDPKQPLENLDKTLGRLHFVRKGKKSFPCFVCGKTIEVGEKSFTRSLREGKMYFPIQKRICFLDGKKLIKEGTIYVGISEEDLEKLK